MGDVESDWDLNSTINSTIWTPRISQIQTAAICITPFMFSVAVYAYSLYQTKGIFCNIYTQFCQSQDSLPDGRFIKKLRRCCGSGRLIKYIQRFNFTYTFYLSFIFTAVIDVLDACFDMLYYFKYETQEDLLPPNVVREDKIINVFLLLAYLSVLKSVILGLLIKHKMEQVVVMIEGNEVIEPFKLIFGLKARLNITIATLIVCFEDAGESFIEYFWVDRYIMANFDLTVLWNCAQLAVVSIFTVSVIISDVIGMSKADDWADDNLDSSSPYSRADPMSVFCFSFSPLLFCIATLLRAGLNFHRAFESEHYINDGCYSLQAGGLVQTPFSQSCSEGKGLDFMLLSVLGLSAMSGLIALFIQLLPNKSNCAEVRDN